MNLTNEENELLLKGFTRISDLNKQITTLKGIQEQVATDECTNTLSLQVHNKNRCTNTDRTINTLIDVLAGKKGTANCLTITSMRVKDRTMLRLLQLMVDENETELANVQRDVELLLNKPIHQTENVQP